MSKSLTLFVGLAGLALVAIIAFFQMSGSVSQSPSVTSSGKALIGGHFSLIDHTGKRVSEKDFLGQYLLVYFGYTYCPEVCPTTLQSISNAMDLLGEQADDVTPLFITVDPERDNREQLAEYVSNFHKRTVGLTGTKDELREVSKAYRVYIKKVISEDAVDFDHSSLTFLMDRDGTYITHFAYGVQGDVMAKKIKSIYKPLEPQKISSTE